LFYPDVKSRTLKALNTLTRNALNKEKGLLHEHQIHRKGAKGAKKNKEKTSRSWRLRGEIRVLSKKIISVLQRKTSVISVQRF
jgi:hypothetical protein